MIDVTVTRKNLEAEGIYSFELARADGRALPPFSAGSHVDVHLPNGLVRQYSLCNHPDEQHRYQIGVLLDPASRGGSRLMHELVDEGTLLRISEPRNLFPLAHGAKRSLLFAGGIGITPILCMAERLAQIGAQFQVHYCSRSQTRTAFVELMQGACFADRVNFHFDDRGDEQKLNAGQVLAGYTEGDHLYVCGPGGFMAFVLAQAQAAGWPEASLHREYFSAEPQVHANDGSFEVQLASSGRCLQIPADRSVADVLLEAGIDLPLSCEQGICGTCLTRVLEGEPDHRDMFLTVEEQARNDQFTPCCSRARTPRLVLDL
ncbi:Vanillate O-demethylase oxidoreductase [Pseudomonas taeanensis MS-3]|uniref:Vanillate O-demethylase oxidoreductase n=1 Tax=Pseudomonas taeanensis MS-3 TaxID=1395571 RepID=A0A0A1YQV5_9PSED|nr:PDR/VanB family oxidoreductase [Pseudomonas taeanensis]KFX71726.1 Vanillate O-demethylase oxidoreductase [Pseudomonas taeanensis MS-3]